MKYGDPYGCLRAMYLQKLLALCRNFTANICAKFEFSHLVIWSFWQAAIIQQTYAQILVIKTFTVHWLNNSCQHHHRHHSLINWNNKNNWIDVTVFWLVILGWLIPHKFQHDFAGRVPYLYQEMPSIWDLAVLETAYYTLAANHLTIVAPKNVGPRLDWVYITSSRGRFLQTASTDTMVPLAMEMEILCRGLVCRRWMAYFTSAACPMTVRSTSWVFWRSGSVALLRRLFCCEIYNNN